MKAEIQLIQKFPSTIYKDIKSYIKSCENCQKQGDLKLETKSKLHSIPVLSNFMKQVGVD